MQKVQQGGSHRRLQSLSGSPAPRRLSGTETTTLQGHQDDGEERPGQTQLNATRVIPSAHRAAQFYWKKNRLDNTKRNQSVNYLAGNSPM